LNKKEMNFGMMESGDNLPLVNFWKIENEKLERAFKAFEESKEISKED
jgi:hypothetical protein